MKAINLRNDYDARLDVVSNHADSFNPYGLEKGDKIILIKDTNVFNSSGAVAATRAMKKGSIGTVVSVDAQYVYLINGDFIVNNTTFYEPDNLTDQLRRVVMDSPFTPVIKSIVAAPGKIAGAVGDAVDSVKAGIDEAGNFLDDILGGLKWVVIAVIIIGAIYLVIQLTKK